MQSNRLNKDRESDHAKERVVLVMTVGTTLEPLESALREEAENNILRAVIAFYGAGLPGQASSPMQVANRLRDIAAQCGCEFQAREIPDPNSLDSCIEVIGETLGKNEVLRSEGIGRIIVDITGGTKPMSAALATVSLNLEADANLCLAYTGGDNRNEHGRVLSESMKRSWFTDTITKKRADEVLASLRSNDFVRAKALSERLPDIGRSRFLKKACEALYLWDAFQYSDSMQIVEQIAESANSFLDDLHYSDLAKSVIQLHAILEDINLAVSFAKEISDPQGTRKDRNAYLNDKISQLPKSERTQKAYILIIADCLENAKRNIDRKPVESVMRLYRALELAVKLRLLLRGINPDRPNWNSISHKVLKNAELKEKTRYIMLESGIRLLKALDEGLTSDFDSASTAIMNKRNKCYLEHGFGEITADDARRLYARAKKAISELADPKILEQKSADVSKVLLNG